MHPRVPHGTVESYGDHSSLSMTCKKLSVNALLASSVSEYQKLVGLVVVMVMGVSEHECTFSTTTYMNTRLRNSLHEHRNLTVQMFVNRSTNCSIVHSTMLSLNGSKSSRDASIVCMRMCIACFKDHLRSVSGEILGNNQSNPSVVGLSVFS